jgi:hypothetical protein
MNNGFKSTNLLGFLFFVFAEYPDDHLLIYTKKQINCF